MITSIYCLSMNHIYLPLSAFISELDNYHSLLSKDELQYTNSITVTTVNC